MSVRNFSLKLEDQSVSLPLSATLGKTDKHFCVEFDNFETHSIIDQAFVDSKFTLSLNARCHGDRRVLKHDLVHRFSGKKVIKSVQERILNLKQFLRDRT